MGLTCIYCGWVGLLHHFEVDHIIPLSRGGSNLPQNLRWICSGCNRQKSQMTHEEYIYWRFLNHRSANYGPAKAG